jgi:hypothetical protein
MDCHAQNPESAKTCKGCLTALEGNRVLETQAEYVARTHRRVANMQTPHPNINDTNPRTIQSQQTLWTATEAL